MIHYKVNSNLTSKSYRKGWLSLVADPIQVVHSKDSSCEIGLQIPDTCKAIPRRLVSIA